MKKMIVYNKNKFIQFFINSSCGDLKKSGNADCRPRGKEASVEQYKSMASMTQLYRNVSTNSRVITWDFLVIQWRLLHVSTKLIIYLKSTQQ